MAKEYERVTIVDHPLVQDKLARLRDKDTASPMFRMLVRELAMLEGYEAARYLPLKQVDVETPLATAHCQKLAIKPVIVPILRAGLGLLEGMLDLMPYASVGHLGMERDEVTHLPRAYYAKMPSDLAQRPVIVVDPMLATGGSAIASIEYLRKQGVTYLTLMVMVAAPEGIEAVLAADENVRIITCAIDDRLNDAAYILPGLGDAGDRIFGTV
ncbi:MAG: uracil phosphoribosyltransferase [Coriobacteriaceae bacterium]|nr:uracil phosphoribosyltransferase [Coriobacteriaceae bacterium]MDO4890708.1 uracil phosphoribosyltransferase [Coriobacteriaceae bacterium]